MINFDDLIFYINSNDYESFKANFRNFTNKNTHNFIMSIAIGSGNIRIIEFLLEEGIDPNVIGKVNNNFEEVIDLLHDKLTKDTYKRLIDMRKGLEARQNEIDLLISYCPLEYAEDLGIKRKRHKSGRN